MKKNTEEIELYPLRSKINSHHTIELKHLANPDSVVISFEGEQIIPESFNIFGEPILSPKANDLCKLKEDSIRRETENSDYYSKFIVQYEIAESNVPKEEFDSLRGIQNSLDTFEHFNQMLKNRRIFYKAHNGKEKLNGFLIFGLYYLNSHGTTLILSEPYLINKGDICAIENFRPIGGYDYYIDYFHTENNKCPYCGKAFTIDSLKNGDLWIDNSDKDELMHRECWEMKRKSIEIGEFCRIIDSVYSPNSPKFDLISNEAYPSCSNYDPWLIFHTPDGDIKIGVVTVEIRIEWLENFKPFDTTIFADLKNHKQWKRKNGKFGIRAFNCTEALEYLKMAHKAANPQLEKRDE